MNNLNTERLILLRGVLRDQAVSALTEALARGSIGAYARAYGILLESDMQDSFAAYIAGLILREDSLFARRACTTAPAKALRTAMANDLRILQELAKKTQNLPDEIRRATEEGFPAIGYGEDNPLFGEDWASDRYDRKTCAVLPQKRVRHLYREQGVYF